MTRIGNQNKVKKKHMKLIVEIDSLKCLKRKLENNKH